MVRSTSARFLTEVLPFSLRFNLRLGASPFTLLAPSCLCFRRNVLWSTSRRASMSLARAQVGVGRGAAPRGGGRQHLRRRRGGDRGLAPRGLGRRRDLFGRLARGERARLRRPSSFPG